MLQFPKFYQKCYQSFRPQENTLVITERNLDEEIQRLTEIMQTEKNKCISSNNLWEKILHKFDQWIWTDQIEYIDLETFPDSDKKKIVHGLHKKNFFFGTYKTFFNIILPYIHYINQKEGRACKILEIAGGSGQLAFFLWKQAKKKNLNVEIISSDIVTSYVLEAEKKASHDQSSVHFKQIDALSLDKLPKGEYDLIINLHSLHHFSPQQLAKIFYGAQLTARAFIAIDAYRGIRNLLFIGGSALLQSLCCVNGIYFHDGWLSARKMYPEKFLESIVKIACRTNRVMVTHPSIGLTALVLEF